MPERIIGYSGFNFTEEKTRELNELAETLGIKLREIPHRSSDVSYCSGCEALAGDFKSSVLEAATDMRWFHSNWAGVDGLVGLSPFRERKALLTSSSGAYNIMLAEHLLSGCLMMLRNFPVYLDAQKKHIWHEAIPAESLWNKRVTVLGVGNTGGAFARLAAAMGAKVSGLDLLRKDKPEWLVSLYSVEQLPDVLVNTEILVMCLPYTKETDKFISAPEIAMLPKGARLLNAGRGKTLDVDALTQALHSGHLAGAMLDVFPEEPLSPDSPLWETPNLFITPHVAGHEADKLNAEYIFNIFVENLHRWSAGEPLVNVVNVERGF